jgi:hypothetical protein
MAPQRLDPTLPCAAEPLTDSARRDPECGGDIVLFPALFFQLPGASPPSFTPVQPGCLGLHDDSLSPVYQPIQTSVSYQTPAAIAAAWQQRQPSEETG